MPMQWGAIGDGGTVYFGGCGDRDEHGHYTGADDTISDHGPR